MKKYLPMLLCLALIVPSVAMASWWNPISWKVFTFLHRSEVVMQTQDDAQKTSEEKISELQKQLDELKNNQVTSDKKIPVVKVPVPAVVPTVPVPLASDVCPNLTGIQVKVPGGMYFYRNTNECLTEEQINASEAINEKLSNTLNAAKKENADLVKKQKELDAVNLEIANLNAKYAEDSARLESNPTGGLRDAVDSMKSNLYRTYVNQYNALMAKYQQIKYGN